MKTTIPDNVRAGLLSLCSDIDYLNSRVILYNRTEDSMRLKEREQSLKKALKAYPQDLYDYEGLGFDPFGRISTQLELKLSDSPSPLFRENDIVFLKKNGRVSEEYPAVGSSYEIDCKIIDIVSIQHGEKYEHRYGLISGRGYHIEGVLEDQLISPNDKYRYSNLPFRILNSDTEIAVKGTPFVLVNGYYSNDLKGIYLGKNLVEKELSHLFDKE